MKALLTLIHGVFRVTLESSYSQLKGKKNMEDLDWELLWAWIGNGTCTPVARIQYMAIPNFIGGRK
jgi:hypothetical protein